ncbi:MAG: esterase-like activity of phytase family protein [Candidatus Hydrogenedentes bacterium]|nr:esterase-like activity of phytase family protein [Candidatus Hydrogenedentota bacterium]
MNPLFFAVLVTLGAFAPRPAELELERALPVDGLIRAEPSGLTIRDGALYTVSDNHTDDIYRLRLEADRAVMEPAIPIVVPDGVRGDYEGITGDGNGGFYLASESQFRILHVPDGGKPAAWVTPSLEAAGKSAGLFQFRGGYFEGIAQIDATHFLLCAERQPRGLMFVNIASVPPSTESFVMMEPTVQPRGLRFPDFTDLWVTGGAIYVLERNAEIISIIERTEKSVTVAPWRSFRRTVDREDLRYADQRFGMAEGLAFDDASVYIILDNNGASRKSNLADVRPLLLIFQRQ